MSAATGIYRGSALVKLALLETRARLRAMALPIVAAHCRLLALYRRDKLVVALRECPVPEAL